MGGGAASASPSSTLVYSVDGGSTWSSNVTASAGQTVYAREYYNNDTDANIADAQVTTTLPSGFTLVAGTTDVCLNPGTTDPTNPTSELECNTNTGSVTPPDDQGGAIDEAAVWTGSNLAISPTAGLFGQPTDATSGILAEGKVKYLNLDNCVYTNGSTQDYTNIVDDTTNDGGAFDAYTNASDTAMAEDCGPGVAGYGHNGSSVQNIDLLGQSTFNLDDCDYYNGTIGDNLSLYDVPQGSATGADNTAQIAQSCTESLGGFGYDAPNSGVASLDLLDNQYINLDECTFGGAYLFETATDVATTGGVYDSGTDASNTPQTATTCGPGAGGYAPEPSNSGLEVLDTLDTTRGQGFVQWEMTAPSPSTTTTYTQTGQLTGTGTGNPSTTGTITIAATVGTPMANPEIAGLAVGGLLVVGLGVFGVRRQRGSGTTA
jgi:hypothetical protein